MGDAEMFHAFREWLESQAVQVKPEERPVAECAFFGGWQVAEGEGLPYRRSEGVEQASDKPWSPESSLRRIQQEAMNETNDLLRRILAHLERGRGAYGSGPPTITTVSRGGASQSQPGACICGYSSYFGDGDRCDNCGGVVDRERGSA